MRPAERAVLASICRLSAGHVRVLWAERRIHSRCTDGSAVPKNPMKLITPARCIDNASHQRIALSRPLCPRNRLSVYSTVRARCPNSSAPLSPFQGHPFQSPFPLTWGAATTLTDAVVHTALSATRTSSRRQQSSSSRSLRVPPPSHVIPSSLHIPPRIHKLTCSSYTYAPALLVVVAPALPSLSFRLSSPLSMAYPVTSHGKQFDEGVASSTQYATDIHRAASSATWPRRGHPPRHPRCPQLHSCCSQRPHPTSIQRAAITMTMLGEEKKDCRER
ncbi:hypothetical protein FB45DRAFT_55349 [Roridomyces roridus]|uniref:Uncharacterized protein n=1 Tax=Roridomyces roridus TaxID=1738132 RepID=A0AAD7FJ35_9AGAR|nr:hypothetical protein FB45DRAFT_55349 [Roridomyces roridus]